MSAEENKALARRFLEEAFVQGDFGAILTPDYHDHNAPPGTPLGPEGIKQITDPYRAAFPDLHFDIADIVAEGDKVAVRYTFSGTQTGALMGLPPSGKRVAMPGISIYRVEGGLLREAWVQYDIMGLMQQLGALPQAAEAAG